MATRTYLAEFLSRVRSSGRLGHVHTTKPDGSPQVSVMWVGLDADDLIIAHMVSGAKIRNLRRDPRVVISFDAAERSDLDMALTLIVHCEATLTEGGAPALLQELPRMYVSRDAVFPPFPKPPEGHIIRIRPTHVGGVGPWTDGH